MIELVIKMLASYLLGSINGALLLGRLKGVDIRELGSGNAGGTNALRTQGKAFAIGTMLIDVGKGIAAVLLVAHLPMPPFLPEATFRPEWIAVSCGAGAMLGHVFPVFYGFRGGKGMATFLGVLGAISWPLLVLAMIIFAIVIMFTGFVSLATIVAALAVPVYALLTLGFGAIFWFGIFMAVFIAWTHRSNIDRLKAGTENRFEKAMIFKRLIG